MNAVAEMFAALSTEEPTSASVYHASTQYKVRSPSGCFNGWVDRDTFQQLPHDWVCIEVHSMPAREPANDGLPF